LFFSFLYFAEAVLSYWFYFFNLAESKGNFDNLLGILKACPMHKHIFIQRFSPVRFMMFFFLFQWHLSYGQSFDLIVAGSGGGLDGSNMSSYLLSPYGFDEYICLDAGSLYHGLSLAREKENLPMCNNGGSLSPEIAFLRNNIKAYLISHAHLDHVAGLVYSSVYDTPKEVYASKRTAVQLEHHLFNWEVWPNFASSGQPPFLNKYRLISLDYGQMAAVSGSPFNVKAFRVSHSEPYQSTAFLIEVNASYAFYLGDTGPDDIEGEGRLSAIWDSLVPLIASGQLKLIIMECSYTVSHPDELLFGHLSPYWVVQELEKLNARLERRGHYDALPGFSVVISGIKPGTGMNSNTAERIRHELDSLNTLKLNFLIPEQGGRYRF